MTAKKPKKPAPKKAPPKPRPKRPREDFSQTALRVIKEAVGEKE